MGVDADLRQKRKHPQSNRSDIRTPFQRDRDKVIYSKAFRRLSGITQVVPPHEGSMLHNRMIHSLKVGHVARGVAEALLHKSTNGQELRKILAPDVVEFAGNAHDLGHPPFGHAAEMELQQLVGDDVTDSFEGNAQTFRILTRLSHGTDLSEQSPGLNLTRASLRSVIKYPWPHDCDRRESKKKWGFFRGDIADFAWVMEGENNSSWCDKSWWENPQDPYPEPSLEAKVVEWADDVTYAVHDFEDFVRSGIIPLWEILSEGRAWSQFEDWYKCKRGQGHGESKERRLPENVLGEVLKLLQKDLIPPKESFKQGKWDEFTGSVRLKKFCSHMVSECINKPSICYRNGSKASLCVNTKAKPVIYVLKDMVSYFVIDGPRLSACEVGYRKMVRNGFNYFREEASKLLSGKKCPQLPPLTLRRTEEAMKASFPPDIPRIACDALCELTELQLVRLNSYLTGNANPLSEPHGVGW
ncbi:MAG: dGTPase [Actinomycetota bacterium]|nr:dGTPase [Actinomycetota bacterium]